MITIFTDNHKKIRLFIKKQKRYLIYRYFTIAIYYQLESATVADKWWPQYIVGGLWQPKKHGRKLPNLVWLSVNLVDYKLTHRAVFIRFEWA